MSAAPTADCALAAVVFLAPPSKSTQSPGPTVGRSIAADGFALASPIPTETDMTTETNSTQTDRIRALNDELRKNFSQGHAVMTIGIAALGTEAVARIVKTIEVYDDFCHANDPHEEHDFGSFEVDGQTIFFKIDYFDKDLTYHSPDPSDPSITERVITIMLAEEY
jgi:hypothetical protein